MNKSLLGLAFLSYQSTEKKVDILDSYIPLICEVIVKNKIKIVKDSEIQDGLKDLFGLNVPIHVIRYMIVRLKKREWIDRKDGEYRVIDFSTINSQTNQDVAKKIKNDFDEIVKKIMEYSISECGIKMSEIEVEKAFIDFLSQLDINFMFGIDIPEFTIIPEKVTAKKKFRYIISNYIFTIFKTDKKKFYSILEIYKGYSIASLLSYEEYSSFSGKLNAVNIYIDAPIIFDIMGTNGDSNQQATDELLSSLVKNGAKLKLFDLNYEEVVQTTEDSIERLKTRNFILQYSSRMIRNADTLGLTFNDLQLKLNTLDDKLKAYGITKEDIPEYSASNKKYVINEKRLEADIKSNYKARRGKEITNPITLAQIERDVNAISAIYRIRKNHIPKTLKDSKAIFVTNNTTIAYTVKQFEKKEYKYKSLIPSCITDRLLGTILWANYPDSSKDLKTKEFLSSCYSNIELDDQLLQNYLNDIQDKHSAGEITEEQFHLLKSSELSYNLLEKMTLNDAEEYTNETPKEILDRIFDEERERYEKERSKNQRIEDRIDFFAKKLAQLTSLLIFVALIIAALIVKPKGIILGVDLTSIIISGITVFMGIFGILRWRGYIPSSTELEKKIEVFFKKSLKKIIGSE
ncbi:MAG: hypothetical protein J7F05_12430 [Trichodesmium erythraeum GBRTRLIN201]|nr:hypothetical protein [Trichodesmium erythraeum GBRTRLIN201]